MRGDCGARTCNAPSGDDGTHNTSPSLLRVATEAPTDFGTAEGVVLVVEDEAKFDAFQSCAKIFRLLLLLLVLLLLLIDVEVEVDAVVVAVATLLVSSSLRPIRARILLSLVVLLVLVLLIPLLLPRRRNHRSTPFFSNCCCNEAFAGISSVLARPLLQFVNIAIVGIFVSVCSFVLVRRWDVVVPI